LLCGGVQAGDLVVEGGGRQISRDRVLPRQSSARCAPAVDHQHREAGLSEPLAGQIGAGGLAHPPRAWAAVGIHQDGQCALAVPTRQQQGRAQLRRRQHREDRLWLYGQFNPKFGQPAGLPPTVHGGVPSCVVPVLGAHDHRVVGDDGVMGAGQR
jgi:hypothetical protein